MGLKRSQTEMYHGTTSENQRKCNMQIFLCFHSQPGELIQIITHIGRTHGFEIDAPVDVLRDRVAGGAPSRRQSRRTSFSALKRCHACRSDAAHLQIEIVSGDVGGCNEHETKGHALEFLLYRHPTFASAHLTAVHDGLVFGESRVYIFVFSRLRLGHVFNFELDLQDNWGGQRER